VGVELDINANTKIIDLLTALPGAISVFSEHGMHCMGCLGAGVETIADSCKMHSIEIETLLKELIDLQVNEDFDKEC